MAWPRSRIKAALSAVLLLGVADLGLLIFVLGPAMAKSQAAHAVAKGQVGDGTTGSAIGKPEPVKVAVAPKGQPTTKPEPVKPAAVAKPEPVKPAAVAKPEPVKPEPVAKPKPVAKPAPAKSAPRTATIRFITGGYGLTEKGKAVVDHVVSTMRRRKKLVVVLRGHADQRGAADFNLRLSQKRARSVSFALRRAGIPKRRIVVEGAGDKEPLSRENTPAAWAQNRRVEVRWQRGTR